MKAIALYFAAGVSALALASAVHAADLIIEDAPEVAGVVETGNWDGPFVGVFGGYGWSELEFEFPPPEPIQPEGWLLGVNAGVNFTLSNGIVAGVVGDIAWANLTDELFFGLGTMTSTVDWAGSVRGRIGYDAGAFLPYLTAGVAFAHNTIDGETLFPFPASDSDDQTHVGWTVGAGVEFAATEDISIDLLYRYSDYGTATYTLFGSGADIGLTAHQLSIGLNFGF